MADVPAGGAPPLDGRRAWWLAWAASAANFITFGTLFSFGVFQKPLAADFGTTTAAVAPMFSLAVCVYYVAGAVGGRLADRHDVRHVLVAAAVLLPAGLVLSSRAGVLWLMYLCFVPLVGVAVGFCYPPLIGAVGRAFERRRALAIAVVLLGVGGGTLVMPNACEALEERFGWRTTFVVLAFVGTAIIVVTALVTGPPRTHHQAQAPLGPVVRSPRFRTLYLSVVLVGPGFYTPLAFYNDYAIDHGIGGRAAAALIGIVGGSSVAARVVFGWRSGRLTALGQYRVGYGFMLAGLTMWLVAGGSYALLVVSAVLHGLGWAAWVTATPLVLADWFGVRDLGGVLGTFYTGLGVGALAGPALSGLIIDRRGYTPAIATMVVATAAALVVALRSMGPAEAAPA